MSTNEEIESFERRAREGTLTLADMLACLERLITPLDIMQWTARVANYFLSENIYLFGDLVQRTEAELLKKRNFGKKSLNEIKDALSGFGFTLGMSDEHPSIASFNIMRKYRRRMILRR